MAYEFDKMSINGTQIDAKDKAAREKLSEIIPDLESARTIAQNALNLATSQSILIADNADNIEAVRGNLQTVTDTVDQIVSDEYQELNFTLQPEFTLQSYSWITCIRTGTLAIISFYGLHAVNTSSSSQGIIRLDGYKAKKPVVAALYNSTGHTAEAMRIANHGNLIVALRTTAGNNYLGMIIIPIEEA